MALSSRMLIASMLVSFLLLQYLTEAADHQYKTMDVNGAPSPQAPTLDCGVACEGRCKLSSRPRLCKRACGSCCDKCNCVPPGTSGNYESCPCYFNLKTHNDTRKCP
ncbi:gibberellin-regulated protein 11-like [Pyrus communis]|uniref:gibberellin-regulated protein 11-like n=1 Tax=Pyrus communis TaxID=23211 RepID=UPI0035C11131